MKYSPKKILKSPTLSIPHPLNPLIRLQNPRLQSQIRTHRRRMALMFLRRANRIHDPGSPLFHGAGSIDRREVGGSGCTDWVLPVPQQDDCGQVGFSQPSGNS